MYCMDEHVGNTTLAYRGVSIFNRAITKRQFTHTIYWYGETESTTSLNDMVLAIKSPVRNGTHAEVYKYVLYDKYL